MRKNIAIILAGGSGKRFSKEIPKQFYMFQEKTILEYSLISFNKNNLIDEIALVVHKDYLKTVDDLNFKEKYPKLKNILLGGDSRSDSSFSAIDFYSNEKNLNLIFHDSARPLVSQKIITDTINDLENFDAVTVGIPSTDTIIKINTENNLIDEIPNRKEMYQVQTPQGFKLEIIKEAYNLFYKNKNFIPTDDTGIVKKFLPKTKIKIIEGSELNIKLTSQNDLPILKKFYEIELD